MGTLGMAGQYHDDDIMTAIPLALLPTAYLEMTLLCYSRRLLVMFLLFLLKDIVKANY